MQRTQISKETRDLIWSSLPLRKLRLRWGSHKGRAIAKSLFASPNPHKGRLVLTKKSPPRRGVIKTIPGAPHKEGTQREMPNHLKVSFKSNKRKSMPGDASSALEMVGIKGALKETQPQTLNHFSNQALAQRDQVLAPGGRREEEWMLKWVFVPW
jgi:hypothetical protein